METKTTTTNGIADQRLARIEMWTQRINLSARRDWGFEGSFTDEVVWLVERLRIAEAALTEIQTNWTKHGKARDLQVGRIAELEEQVGREIRVRNNVIAELKAERDDLKESLRTTRLEQAAKAFQVDELETKLATAEAERELADGDLQSEIRDHGETAKQLEEMTNWRTHTQNEVDELETKVERLTEALEHIRDFKPNTEGVPAEMRVLAKSYLTGIKES